MFLEYTFENDEMTYEINYFTTNSWAENVLISPV